jgi:hypothetical protein
MASQKIRNNVEVFHDAIVDGINRFGREVLVARGFLDARKLEGSNADDLDELKHAIASRVAASWETCAIDEQA